MLEVNARTTRQNRLCAAAGIDIDFTGYLDTIGQPLEISNNLIDHIVWQDDYFDILSSLTLLKQRKLRFRDIVISPRAKRINSIFALDDPIPYFAEALNLGNSALRLIFDNDKSKKL
jgi:predicted ATP-grasp superfamily ATP-dependent carboligase